MNKPIINGIDVSECEYINCCSKKAKCIILQDDISSDSQYCESEPNCYFKQLKRLEQENKCLKEEIEFIADKKVMTFSCFKYIKEHQEKLEQIEFNEKIYTMSGLAKEFNINRHTLYSRLKNGWSIEKALTPPRKYEVLNDRD